jgi:opacity protein-like surface antigen
MQKIAFLVVCLSTFTLSGFAQKSELAFVVGAKVTPSVGSSFSLNHLDIGTTPVFEGNYAARLLHAPGAALHLEFPFAGATAADLTTANLTTVKSYSAIFFTPSLRLKFIPGSPISPWVSAGGGLAHFSPSSTTVAGAPTNVSSTTKGAFQGGAGLDFHIPAIPIGLRIEARDFYTGKPNLSNVTVFDVRHNIIVGGGVVLRF